MCDREEFRSLRGRVEAVERADAVQQERLDRLSESVTRLADTLDSAYARQSRLIYFMIVLFALALVYGALGERGFNAVARAAAIEQETQQQEGNHDR